MRWIGSLLLLPPKLSHELGRQENSLMNVLFNFPAQISFTLPWSIPFQWNRISKPLNLEMRAVPTVSNSFSWTKILIKKKAYIKPLFKSFSKFFIVIFFASSLVSSFGSSKYMEKNENGAAVTVGPKQSDYLKFIPSIRLPSSFSSFYNFLFFSFFTYAISPCPSKA